MKFFIFAVVYVFSTATAFHAYVYHFWVRPQMYPKKDWFDNWLHFMAADWTSYMGEVLVPAYVHFSYRYFPVIEIVLLLLLLPFYFLARFALRRYENIEKDYDLEVRLDKTRHYLLFFLPLTSLCVYAFGAHISTLLILPLKFVLGFHLLCLFFGLPLWLIHFREPIMLSIKHPYR